MVLTLEVDKTSPSDSGLTLDWESVGELVRRRTLEVVAMHFAALAAEDEALAGARRGLPAAAPERGSAA